MPQPEQMSSQKARKRERVATAFRKDKIVAAATKATCRKSPMAARVKPFGSNRAASKETATIAGINTHDVRKTRRNGSPASLAGNDDEFWSAFIEANCNASDSFKCSVRANLDCELV